MASSTPPRRPVPAAAISPERVFVAVERLLELVTLLPHPPSCSSKDAHDHGGPNVRGDLPLFTR